jgi:hypothetical protein
VQPHDEQGEQAHGGHSSDRVGDCPLLKTQTEKIIFLFLTPQKTRRNNYSLKGVFSHHALQIELIGVVGRTSVLGFVAHLRE